MRTKAAQANRAPIGSAASLGAPGIRLDVMAKTPRPYQLDRPYPRGQTPLTIIIIISMEKLRRIRE
jgi:hypothetical protein